MKQDIQDCIDNCLRCYQTCFGMAMNHCQESGGKHVEPAHVRLMTAGIVLSFVGHFVPGMYSDTLWMQIAVSVAGLTLMTGVAFYGHGRGR